MSAFFVYVLECSDGATYVGATMDLDRRLRQHNKEIQGGAHATGVKVGRGHTWRRACYVSGFPDWQSTLQFEWRLKQLARKLHGRESSPIARRLIALKQLLAMDRSTSRAIPFQEWLAPPEVHFEHDDVRDLYEEITVS